METDVKIKYFVKNFDHFAGQEVVPQASVQIPSGLLFVFLAQRHLLVQYRQQFGQDVGQQYVEEHVNSTEVEGYHVHEYHPHLGSDTTGHQGTGIVELFANIA